MIKLENSSMIWGVSNIGNSIRTISPTVKNTYKSNPGKSHWNSTM